MFSPRPQQLKRAVAALLPVSLLWVFAACVSACGWEAAAPDGRPDFALTVEAPELREAAGCEDCPDASLLRVTAPERVTFKPELKAAGGVPALGFAAAPPADPGASAFRGRQQFLPDPPLELLPTLRI